MINEGFGRDLIEALDALEDSEVQAVAIAFTAAHDKALSERYARLFMVLLTAAHAESRERERRIRDWEKRLRDDVTGWWGKAPDLTSEPKPTPSEEE